VTRILITGATGFVGRAVTRLLREQGHTLTGTTRDKGLRAGPENIPLYYMPEFSTEMDWSQAVSGAEAVIHLAARVHQMQDQAPDPLAEFRRVNVYGTVSLARAASDADVKRFVYLSSIKVNGEKTEESPFSDENPPEPLDDYGLSKWEAEQALMEMTAGSGMEAVILRPPLVYGSQAGGNFATLAKAVLKGTPLPLGAVTNRRSLLYVDNLASAISVCLRHPKAAGETFLVSDGEDVSIGDLIRRMAGAAGIGDKLFYCPLWLLHIAGALSGRRETIARITESLEVDSSKIRELLEWSPPATMDAGLRETMAAFAGAQSLSPEK